MPRSLYARFAIVLVALLLAVGLLGLLGTWATTGLYREEVEQRLNLDLAEHLLGEGPLMVDGEVSDASREHLLHMLMVINPRLEIYLIDRDGGIRDFSAEEGRVKLDAVDLAPIERLLAGDARLPIRGDDPRHPGRKAVFSVAPIENVGGFDGFLYVVLGGDQYQSIAELVRESLILRLSAIWGGALILLAAAVGAVVFYLLTRRLRRLDARIQHYRAESGPDSHPHEGGDELDRLLNSFGAMRERIDAQMSEIETIERQRRELVANVSHDLRTPLAALQGYLETLMLKGERLDEKLRGEYLQIAYRQSESLGRLVDQLFELSTLDAGDGQLEIETFSVAELIQDVTVKFQLQAEKRGLTLSAQLPSEDRTMVSGDLRLLERALDNLIENALRHTPEGGAVTVGVEGDGDSIAVRISDTGKGIPEDDLARVFDRFYRGTERRAEESGSGLGLTIVKRILELHGSTIRAVSRPGEGSTFAFELVRAA